jgi:hypothetical protein
MAEVALTCASYLLLERCYGAIDRGSKNDSSTVQHIGEADKKAYICCTTVKKYSAFRQLSAVAQPTRFTEYPAHGM